jgi:hypothetical protein
LILRPDDFWTRRRVKEAMPYGERPIPEIPPPPFTGATFSGTLLYRSTSQTIVTSTITNASFSNESYDTEDLWDSGSPTILTMATGIYLFNVNVSFASNATGYRSVTLWNSSASLVLGEVVVPAVNGSATVVSLSVVRALSTAGAVLTLRLWQTSGGDLAVSNGGTNLMLSVINMGAVP